ncbi:MAG: C25 family cysteine peptidase [bacterium]
MKRFFYFSFSILFIVTAAILPAKEIEGVKYHKEGNSYYIDFKLPAFNFEKINVSGEDYVKLVSQYMGITPDVGLPQLPQLSFNFVIAKNQIPVITVLDSDEEIINLNYKIYPSQMPWEKNKPLEDRPFSINNQYYQSHGNSSQSLVTLSEPFVIGGATGMIVTINPFKYDPLNNELSFINSASIKLDLGDEADIAYERSNYFNRYLQNIFINHDNDYVNRTTDKSLNYLIITAPTFETSLQTFVDHKTSKGYNVSLFTTAITGTTTAAIKTFIQTKYDNLSTRPDFILFVGDIAAIPAWTGSGEGNPLTDLKYVQLEGGDSFADAFIGRFSVTSETELTNAMNKSIYMENYVGTIAKKNVFMASSDNWDITEATHNYVIDTHFGPDGYTNLKLFTHTYSATTQQLINALNDNQRFAIYSGHGSTTSWADGPVLSQAQVRSLTNTTIYPFVYSFACVTGQFNLAECFGETWLRAEHGGSTFYGSSVNSYWDEDDILERRLIDAMYNDDLTKVTPMMDQAKIYLVNHYGSVTQTMLRYLEMYNLMGDPSQPTIQEIPPDNTAPEAITDLAAGDATSTCLKLTWTAPYDSTIGGIVTYDIRYSSTIINNDTDFNNASQLILAGQSDAVGTAKVYICNDLNFDSDYYFAIKAADIWGNMSPISNVCTGHTWEAPEIDVTPEGVAHIFNLNEAYEDSVIVTNCSDMPSTMDYEVTYANNTFPIENFRISLVPIPKVVQEHRTKNEKENNTDGGQAIKGSGGPDTFGYSWIDSSEPNGPTFVWNDISATGTTVTFPNGTLDDGYTNAIPMGISFKYYDVLYTNIYISTNGFLSLGSLTNSYVTNSSLPNSSAPNNIIAPFWDDLEGRTQGSVKYQQVGDKFIVQFTNWQRYSSSGGTGSYSFQIVLAASGKIMFYYQNMVGTLNSATVGIENSTGTDGLQICMDASYIANNLAVKIEAEPEWFLPTAPSGTLYSGNSVAVEYQFITNDIPVGEYSIDLVINSNCPDRSSVVVPIALTVTENGAILRTVDVNSGWNLISVPTDATDMNKNILFPTAVSDAFTYNGSYLSSPVLSPGNGYWLKFDEDNTFTVTGLPHAGNIPVNAGWNIVGPFGTDVQVADITTNPASIIESDFFGYNGSYLSSAQLNVGKGYWIKVSQAGELILNTARKETVAKSQLTTKQVSDAIVNIPMIATDGISSYNINLCAGIDPSATNGIDALLGEPLLPPAAPGFDARFVCTDAFNSFESYKDYRDGGIGTTGNFMHKLNYRLEAGSTGLTLNFTLPAGVSMTITDLTNGTLINQTFKAGTGTFSNPLTSAMNGLNIILSYDGSQMPVQLTSFAATSEGSDVVLTWKTSAEINNKGFDVERKVENGVWSKVGYVEGKGTTKEETEYRYSDKVVNVSGKEIYYRLKQIDETGSVNYSEDIKVEIMPQQYVLEQNFPNPFNPTTKIKYALPFESAVKLTIYNMLGEKVAELYNNTQSAGYYEYNWNAYNFSSGIYIMSLEAKSTDGKHDNFRAIKKMMIMK